MKIINLIENTSGRSDCSAMHGLSFYIETKKHKVLSDLGPSGETLANAEKLGIDLKQVDIVILSHGHYDHSGGIMPFSEINNTADIYMQETAGGEYYSKCTEKIEERPEDNLYRYIGIDKAILDLKQVKKVSGNYTIDDELSVFTIANRRYRLPYANDRLMIKTEAGYVRDDFCHEHFLVVTEGDRKVLISGCAHNGILNILEEYRSIYGSDPEAVISGFHLMKKDPYNEKEEQQIKEIAEKLNSYKTKFFTCHCTGLPAFSLMKEIMGDKLQYVHCGDEVVL